MALPINAHMPSYIIYRDTDPDQPYDPGAHLLFFPPKDSDELFDALRIKFPQIKSHSERVREAVFEFLLEESQQGAMQQPVAPNAVDIMSTYSWAPSFDSMLSDASTWNSPEDLGLESPPYEEAWQSQPRSRQYSTASETAPSEPSPPALEQMTGVFSLTDSAQPKQRVRRKMTEQEKVEYRKRRIVKACEKCSKRKRKCTWWFAVEIPDTVAKSGMSSLRSADDITTAKFATELICDVGTSSKAHPVLFSLILRGGVLGMRWRSMNNSVVGFMPAQIPSPSSPSESCRCDSGLFPDPSCQIDRPGE